MEVDSSALWAQPWPLLVLPLALRLIPWRRSDPEGAPRWQLDLPVALVLAVGVALLSTAVLSVHLTEYFPLSAADFDHYCDLVARVAVGDTHDYVGQRLPPPAWLPAALSSWLGLIDGLALQSFLALTATCAGLYLWGLSLHGRTAGLCAALLAGTVGPVAFLARDVSFYPVVVAASVVSAAAVAACLRFRTAWPALLAGLAAAVALLSDVRGVLFAVPLVLVGMAASAVRGKGWQSASLRVGLLLAPVVASWFVARAVVPAQTVGLERQALLYADQAVRDAGGSSEILSPQFVQTQVHTGFVWGHTPLTKLPDTFLFSRGLLASIPPDVRDSPQNRSMRERHLQPWLVPGLVAGILALLGLARRRWRLMALLVSAAPFVSMLWATGQVLPQERHLATGLAVIPLLLGLGVAVLAEGSPSPSGSLAGGTRGGAFPWRRWVLFAALVSVMLGFPPSWLGFEAGWRKGIVQSEPRTILQHVSDGKTRGEGHCTQALEQHRHEHWWPSRLYPRAARVLDGSDAWAPD